jgi:hypothetical protein
MPGSAIPGPKCTERSHCPVDGGTTGPQVSQAPISVGRVPAVSGQGPTGGQSSPSTMRRPLWVPDPYDQRRQEQLQLWDQHGGEGHGAWSTMEGSRKYIDPQLRAYLDLVAQTRTGAWLAEAVATLPNQVAIRIGELPNELIYLDPPTRKEIRHPETRPPVSDGVMEAEPARVDVILGTAEPTGCGGTPIKITIDLQKIERYWGRKAAAAMVVNTIAHELFHALQQAGPGVDSVGTGRNEPAAYQVGEQVMREGVGAGLFHQRPALVEPFKKEPYSTKRRWAF